MLATSSAHGNPLKMIKEYRTSKGHGLSHKPSASNLASNASTGEEYVVMPQDEEAQRIN